ncbi:sigma-70 family RNA polymerase sigma factor [Streptomyces sp. NPDC054933]
MHVEGGIDTELVAAARAGDEEAREQLVAAYLPLVYNIVGRAMNGHPDVDDVVQETMIRVVGGLGGLRDTSSFRSWVVAVAMNEVRRCWSSRRTGSVSALDSVEQVADPAGDFVELTVLRLGLSGQRREVAEATRWLDERDRELLSLWWLEAAGQLTRAELAAALELSPQHAAVRIQRMKEQLDLSRTVIRSLAATPGCPRLAELTATWDWRPSALWRKRIARHARSCQECSALGQDLVPAEGLLAGLVLVVPLHGFAAHFPLAAGLPLPSGHTASGPATTAHPAGPAGELHAHTPHTTHQPFSADRGMGRADAPRPRSTRRGAPRRVRPGAQLAGLLAVAIAVVGIVRALPDQAEPSRAAGAPSIPTGAFPTTALPAQTPTTSASPTPTPPPSSTPPATPTPPSLEQQLIELINAERAKSGCRPLHVDPKLHTAAQQHSEDMAAHRYFDHVDLEGGHADSRITAAHYQWSTWGENLDRNTKTPGDVLNDWLDGAIHQQNILNCQFTDAGVGTAPGTVGLLWTLDLAAPS